MSWYLVPCLGIGIEPWSSRTVCRTPGLCICSINLNSGHLHEGREPSQVQHVPAGPMEMSVEMSVEMSMFPGTLTAALARVHPLCFVQSLQSCSAATTSAQAWLFHCSQGGTWCHSPCWGQTPRQPHKPLVPSQPLSWASHLDDLQAVLPASLSSPCLCPAARTVSSSLGLSFCCDRHKQPASR